MRIRSNVQKVCYALLRYSREADEHVSDGAASTVTAGELVALEAIVESANSSAALAQRLSCSVPNAADLVSRLQSKRLIRKEEVTGRPSAVLLRATQEGLKVVERMKDFDQDAEAELKKMLPRLDLDALRSAIGKIP